MRRARRLAAVLAVAALVAGGCRRAQEGAGRATPMGPEPAATTPTAVTPTATQNAVRELTVQMRPQSDSGQSGTATLTPLEGGRTRVRLELTSSPPGPQPAHIHPGTCAALDPAPRHGLTSVTNGRSETDVAVSIDTLLAGTFAINVHKSAREASVYVSCGEIRR